MPPALLHTPKAIALDLAQMDMVSRGHVENRGYESEVTRLLSALNQREGREEGRSDWR